MAKHPAYNYNQQPSWTKNQSALRDQPSDLAITAKQLRDELFEAIAETPALELKCHTIKEFKYGEIVSTSSVTGVKVVTDDHGQKHLVILTN